MRKFFPSLVCPLIALAAVLGAANQSEAEMWSLADDFSYAENSNTSTWSYRLDDNAGSYPLLTSTALNANDIWGTAFPDPPLMWSGGAGTYWGVGKNLSGVTQSAGTTDWAPDEILFHPQHALPGRMVFSWLSPVDMTVDANYTFGSAMALGNGVGYRIVHRNAGGDTTLIDFSASTYVGMGSLSGSKVVTVAVGDRLNFSFDNWGNAGGDITRAAITIEEYVPPQPYALPFTEDFSGFTNPQTFGTQVDTDLDLTWGGNVPGWTDDNPSHTVDLDPDSEVTDIAMMFWSDYNRMTLDTGILANDLGTVYEVSFDAGPTVYAAAVQATGPDSGLVIDILNASGGIVESFTHLPGAWPGGPDAQALSPVSFTYTGDGDGPARIRIQSNNYPGQFGGAIDNLSVVPEPSSFVLASLALIGLGLLGWRRKRA